MTALLLFCALLVGDPVPLASAEEHALVELLRSTRQAEFAGIDALLPSVREVVSVRAQQAIDLVSSERVPALREGEDWQTLSIVQRELLLLALESETPHAAREAAHEFAENPDTVCAAIHLLGAGGDAPDVAEIAEWATLAIEEDRCDRAMGEALRRAWSRLATREGDAFEWLVPASRQGPDELLLVLLPAIGDTRDPRAAVCLAEVMKRETGVLAMAIGQMRHVGPALDTDLRASMEKDLIEIVRTREDSVGDEAMRVLAQMRSTPGVELFLDRLEHSERGRVDAAHWSLAEISGIRAGADFERWHAWFARENQTFNRRREYTRDLMSRDAVRQAAAIRRITRQRLNSSTWSQLLISMNPAGVAVEKLRTDALGRLGAAESIPHLLRQLQHPQADCRTAAFEALRLLTGFELPAVPEVWRAKFAG